MFRLFTVSAVVTLFLLNCSNDNRIVAAGTHETSVASIKITMAQDSPFRRLADSAVITVSAGDMLTITQELTVTDSSVEGSIKGIPVGKARFFSLTASCSLNRLFLITGIWFRLGVGSAQPISKITPKRIDMTVL